MFNIDLVYGIRNLPDQPINSGQKICGGKFNDLPIIISRTGAEICLPYYPVNPIFRCNRRGSTNRVKERRIDSINFGYLIKIGTDF